MKLPLSETERKVLAVIQDGFVDTLSPYEDMAAKAGIDVEEFLSVLKKWEQDGKVNEL